MIISYMLTAGGKFLGVGAATILDLTITWIL